MDKVLETYSPPKLNKKKHNLNRPITRSEIEYAIKKLPIDKSPALIASLANSTKHTKNLY